MTAHDPLCTHHATPYVCDCNFIARARADEREQIVAEITMRCHALRHPNPCPYCDPFINIARGGN